MFHGAAQSRCFNSLLPDVLVGLAASMACMGTIVTFAERHWRTARSLRSLLKNDLHERVGKRGNMVTAVSHVACACDSEQM